MKTIGFFSSDARQLYKEDIYRALALPIDYIIHFRYQEQYIEGNLLHEITNNTLAGRKGVIFFTKNNPIGGNKSDIENISIRECVILSHKISETTKLYHFFLKLGEFKDFLIDSNNALEKLPPKKFISEIDVTMHNDHAWKDRILKVCDSFSENIFFNINDITNEKNEKQALKYYEQNRNSHYELYENERYFLNISIYEKDKNDDFIKITDDNKVVLNVTSPKIRANSRFDDKSIILITKPIDTNKVTNIVKFEVEKNNTSSCEMNLEISIKKSFTRSFIFFIFSMLIFLTLTANNFFTDGTVKIFVFNFFQVMVSIVFGLAATFLFNYFNKK